MIFMCVAEEERIDAVDVFWLILAIWTISGNLVKMWTKWSKFQNVISFFEFIGKFCISGSASWKIRKNGKNQVFGD